MMRFEVSWGAILEAPAGRHTRWCPAWAPHTLDTTHPHHPKQRPSLLQYSRRETQAGNTSSPSPRDPNPETTPPPLPAKTSRVVAAPGKQPPAFWAPRPQPRNEPRNQPAPNDIHHPSFSPAARKDDLQRSAARARKRVHGVCPVRSLGKTTLFLLLSHPLLRACGTSSPIPYHGAICRFYRCSRILAKHTHNAGRPLSGRRAVLAALLACTKPDKAYSMIYKSGQYPSLLFDKPG